MKNGGIQTKDISFPPSNAIQMNTWLLSQKFVHQMARRNFLRFPFPVPYSRKEKLV